MASQMPCLQGIFHGAAQEFTFRVAAFSFNWA
jgi:hypothetical protein